MPAYTPLSYVELVGNGVNTSVAVPFPFLKRSHVGIYRTLNVATGNFASQLVEGTDYVWVNDTTITLTPAIANGVAYTVRRLTPRSALISGYNDGSNLTALNLNNGALQVLYAIQELADATVAGAVVTDLLIGISTGSGGYGYERIATIANLPTSPTTGKLVEVVDTTGIEGLASVVGEPAGFVGSNAYSARLQWTGSNWLWLDYMAKNPGAQYLGQGLQDALNTVGNTLTPVGTIVWLQRTAPDAPAGWIYCSGANKSRNQYPGLFSTIGTTYGAGDGLTTFGIPLQASLTPPSYATDSSWRPFLKYGAKIGEDGVIFIGGAAGGNAILTYNVTGSTFTLRSTPDVPPVSSEQESVSMTPDGSYIAAAGQGTDKLWTGIRNGNGWSKMTVSDPPLSDVAAVAITNDGLTLVAVMGTTLYQWTRSGLTWGSRVTVDTSVRVITTPLETAEWSPDGNYLAIGLFSSSRPVVYKKSGNTITRLPDLPPGAQVFNGCSWHPSGLFLTMNIYGVGGIVNYIRSGDSFALGAVAPGNFNTSARKRIGWSADGTRVVVPHWFTGSGAKIWGFDPLTGLFSILPSNVTTGTSYGCCRYPGSNTEFFGFYDQGIYSFKTGTLELVASNAIPGEPFGFFRDGVMGTTA